MSTSSGIVLDVTNQLILGSGVIGNGLTLEIDSPSAVIANASGQTLVLNSSTTNNGLLEATNGGTLLITGTVNNLGQNLVSSGGTIQVAGGTLQGTWGGPLQTVTGNSATLDGVTNGALTFLPGSVYTSGDRTTLVTQGNIVNNGSINLAAGVFGSFLTLAANTTLSGTGALTLSTGAAFAVITTSSGQVQTLTNQSTIQGAGWIEHPVTVLNQGTILANVSGQPLYVDGTITNTGLMEATNGGTLSLRSSGGPVTNSGTLEAAGGTLVLSGSGGFTNTAAGVLEAINGGTVLISATTVNNLGQNIVSSGGTIQVADGTLQGTWGGALQTATGHSATLDGVTNGALTFLPGSVYTSGDRTTLVTQGNIVNNGSINLTAGVFGSFLTLAANTTLSGTGTLTLSTGAAFAVIQANGVQTLTNQSTIQGAGWIVYPVTVLNQGTILANVSGQPLYVDGAITNTGLMEATNGGTLSLRSSGGPVTNSGTLQANGGTLKVTNLTNFNGNTLTGGTYIINGATGSTGTLQLSSLGNNAAGEIVNNAATIILNGPNANTLFQDAGGNAAVAPLANNSGSLTISGGYNFTTAGNLQNSGAVDVETGSKLSTGTSNYSQTAGSTTIGGLLTTNNYTQTNGTTTVENGGKLTITGMLTQSGGVFDVQPGGAVDPLNYYVNGGIAEVDGDLIANVFVANGAQLTGIGTIAGSLNYAGVFSPGSNGLPGGITVAGNFSLFPTSLFIESIAGVNNFGILNDSGNVALGGALDVELLNFMPTIGSEFTFIDAQMISGVFATTNLPNLGPSEEFIVQYNPTNVELCAVSPSNPVCGAAPPSTVPEPSSIFLLSTVGIAALWCVKQTRRRCLG